MDIEIIVQPNGQMCLPRLDSASNQVIRNIVDDMVEDHEGLQSFYAIADEQTHLFGEKLLCG